MGPVGSTKICKKQKKKCWSQRNFAGLIFESTFLATNMTCGSNIFQRFSFFLRLEFPWAPFSYAYGLPPGGSVHIVLGIFRVPFWIHFRFKLHFWSRFIVYIWGNRILVLIQVMRRRRSLICCVGILLREHFCGFVNGSRKGMPDSAAK